MTDVSILDGVYDRLSHTGPEFVGWLSNHGPMAADAMLRLGYDELQVSQWIDTYERHLEEAPRGRWAIDEDEWREPLGDASRLGDWCALFARQVEAEPWEGLLARWWPRLLPGSVASATHCLIRTGHAVRALREHVTAARLREFGAGLGYWAARWQPIPGQRRPLGARPIEAALDALPGVNSTGGARTRIAQLEQTPSCPVAVAALKSPVKTMEVPAALDALVDAAVTRYGRWAHGSPIMLVHAATAPRAAALVLPALSKELWRDTYDTAWASQRRSARLICRPTIYGYGPTRRAPQPQPTKSLSGRSLPAMSMRSSLPKSLANLTGAATSRRCPQPHEPPP